MMLCAMPAFTVSAILDLNRIPNDIIVGILWIWWWGVGEGMRKNSDDSDATATALLCSYNQFRCLFLFIISWKWHYDYLWQSQFNIGMKLLINCGILLRISKSNNLGFCYYGNFTKVCHSFIWNILLVKLIFLLFLLSIT